MNRARAELAAVVASAGVHLVATLLLGVAFYRRVLQRDSWAELFG